MTEVTCRLASCMMNWIIESRLNHYLIFIVLCLETVMQSQQQKQQWKSMNTEKITAKAQHFYIFIHFIISEAIEQYMNYLMKFIKQFVKNTILFIKSAVNYFCFWWTSEINEAVCRVKETWRCEDHDKKIIKMNKHKKKIICRIKISQFQNSIHQIAFSSKNIWKLMKWIKKHNHFFSE